MKVLVTGGAGYIGSTVCSALIDKGHTPVILDSLVTGRVEFTKDKVFYKGDIADKELLAKIFKDHPEIEYVVHCAALIIVPESVEHPFEYYRENVAKSLELFSNLHSLGCRNIIFSSSASIYDDVEGFMVTEKSPLNPRSPYARTKYMIEMILKDFCTAYGMRGIALRYFNPIGADPKMRSGVHIQFPSHVLGKLVEVALGISGTFYITGTKYNTRDGSGIRDYIHVWDLALAHVKAIESFDYAFNKAGNPEYLVINLGTGSGVTVKELVTAFEKVYNQTINKKEVESRPGDVPGAYANADKALRLLNWMVEKSIEDGIEDALKWGNIRETIIKY
jgi:UDP-glucose 4-epimerase